ncbi:hypothetical protein TREMEDRAFT_59988 [Tremella mesenterica DSM 1558]|uniref:uncharacterized protein n=1 Tax=Tremella mesenterica (strain ATCC 24925 / CBS 8224 / DSM 1558 / NBRC 9311 / NRRL Y-6157 / RJB 2259-6 / UBC 559-6) TaxID=578456 RepID=UPI0003F49A9B|nr:uncharacterized protein TREMEDRAFT_59988 [Tremella mesenterica DSM 1558]EIW71044.1 hypothetical protein TREMEDRAFT_59988 [Tremella mesenterica DSM 1558]
MADFSAVYNSVPPVTRTLLLATVIITGPCLLQIIRPVDVAFIWWRITRRWEVWRLVTSFFYGGGGFPFLYDLFLIYRNSSALERNVYMSNTAEYAWMHVMLATFILIFNIPLEFPFFFRSLLHAQTYLWCRANPTTKVSIFGLLTIPTSLYPPALIVLDLLTGGPMKAISGLLGLFAGHLWWFLSSYLPVHAPVRLRRPNPLSTPNRFRSLFSSSSRPRTSGGYTVTPPTRGTTTARPVQDAAEAVRHRWGGGSRLGGEPL